MKRNRSARRLLVLPFALVLASGVASAQGQLGSLSITGPALVDGQSASGNVAVGKTARVATGANGAATLALAGGGEVKTGGQAEVVVSAEAAGPRVQLVCGAVTVTSATPATITSQGGSRVFASAGKVVVTADGKSTTIKQGKTKDFGPGASIVVTGANATAVVTSTARCNCDCH
jgi:hypothetical protein